MRINIPYSGDNVHGELGPVGEWATHRQEAENWIASNALLIEDVARHILRRTAMDNTTGIESIVRYVTTGVA